MTHDIVPEQSSSKVSMWMEGGEQCGYAKEYLSK